MLIRSGRPGEVSAELAGGIDHVFERWFDLFPSAGLEAAIGIDPKLLGREDLDGATQQAGHLVARGDARGMDVVDTGADLVGVAEVDEHIEQLHPRAGRLDRDHVGVHRFNGFQNVVELRVAHVCMDLCLVPHNRSRKKYVGQEFRNLGLPCYIFWEIYKISILY